MLALKKYLLNCFLLLVPILVWNLVFTKSLPKGYSREFFWNDIPVLIGTTENILRILVFVLTLFMPLHVYEKSQKIGLGLYVSGVVLYAISWLMQIYAPGTAWSNSVYGFLAPAYITLIWFMGIGLIGNSLFFIKIPFYSVLYSGLATFFVIVHSIHAYIVYTRL